MFDLFTDDVRRDPFSLYRNLRTASPVLAVPGMDLWVLLDYASVKRALHDHEAFSSVVSPPSGRAPEWLIFSDPPRHTKLRVILARAFTPPVIAALEPRVRELSRELLEPVVARGEMDLVTEYADRLPMMVIAELLGIPAADQALLRRWSEVVIQLSYALTGGARAEQAFAANVAVRDEMRRFLHDVLAARRREPTDDLLSRLVHAEVDGERLHDDEILGFFQLLLLAGTETTTCTIANAVLCLLEAPAQLDRLRRDRTLLPSAVEEVIRHRSPTQFVFRQTRTDVELPRGTIPAGKLVLAVVGSANRDEACVREPERFEITRTPNPHVGFGHGIHFCLGAALARLEARVALGDLLEHLGSLALASDEPWEPRQGLLVHGPARLPVRFDPAGTTVGA